MTEGDPILQEEDSIMTEDDPVLKEGDFDLRKCRI